MLWRQTSGRWVGVAVVAAVTVQSAFQEGPLAASLPTLTAVEPLVSGLIGVGLFQERLTRRPLFLLPLLVALAAVGVGIFTLGRSPLVAPAPTSPWAARGPDKATS